MSGSTFGNIFRVTTWGESHGAGIGAVVDGCPAGIELDEEYIQKFLDRRKPGQSKYTTPRKEADKVKIMSGVFEGKTTGTPISLVIENTSQISKDYSDIADKYRPGHADYGYDMKYGFRDYRGGGRSSGRETAGRVAAGAIAIKALESLGISIIAYVKQIGDIVIDYNNWSYDELYNNSLCMPDKEAAERAAKYIDKLIEEKDSTGALVECFVGNVPAGIGNPVFDKLDARLAGAVMSIGAVKGVEIGDGFEVVTKRGSENNDSFCIEDGIVDKVTNHSGGILGGISDGSTIVLRAAFKPTPSIFQKQRTIDKSLNETEIEIKGRHDPIIAPRAVVVVESMVAMTILDLMMANSCSTIDKLMTCYGASENNYDILEAHKRFITT
ncbi:MAG TPA: chorismate synthase [Lachnospiraceae bacterium]|nr:chorismate synthase [Lachnospiraceae bacterium]